MLNRLFIVLLIFGLYLFSGCVTEVKPYVTYNSDHYNRADYPFDFEDVMKGDVSLAKIGEEVLLFDGVLKVKPTAVIEKENRDFSDEFKSASLEMKVDEDYCIVVLVDLTSLAKAENPLVYESFSNRALSFVLFDESGKEYSNLVRRVFRLRLEDEATNLIKSDLESIGVVQHPYEKQISLNETSTEIALFNVPSNFKGYLRIMSGATMPKDVQWYVID